MAKSTGKRELYSLRGGPMDGLEVPLAKGDHTLVFCLRGECGRYQYVEGKATVLHWQPSGPVQPEQRALL